MADKPLVTAWSFSRLQCYEECPAKFKYRFIDKVPEEKSPQMQRGIDIHKEGERYLKAEVPIDAIPESFSVNGFGPLLNELRTAGAMAEEQWALDPDWRATGWFSKGKHAAYVRIVADAALLYDDNTALIVDFKTGKPWGDNIDQMQLFADVTFCRHPQMHEVETRLWYLDTGDEKTETFRRKGLNKRIDEWEDRVEPLFTDREFRPKPSNKCNWCPFSGSKGGPCVY